MEHVSGDGSVSDSSDSDTGLGDPTESINLKHRGRVSPLRKKRKLDLQTARRNKISKRGAKSYHYSGNKRKVTDKRVKNARSNRTTASVNDVRATERNTDYPGAVGVQDTGITCLLEEMPHFSK